jgi:hypothetical protein
MEHATWIKATAPSCGTPWTTCKSAHCSNARGLQAPSMPPLHAQCSLFERLMDFFCDVLPAWKHGCMFVGAVHFQERSCDMVHHNCLDSLTAGLKQAITICIIAHLYHGFYHEVLSWFCGFALELELAPSGAVHPASFPMAGPWCQGQ